MPLDFPSAPAINDTWTGSNGATYTWDGTKWTVSGSAVGPYLPLAGGTMTGALALAADPTTSPQAANKHYVDQSINLAGNYLGTWSVAANSPNISAGGSISNANYVATTVVPATPEVVPAGVPGIAGLTVANGDRVIWASGLGTWQILRNAGVTLAAADARYVALGGSTMTGALTLPANAASALQAVPLQQVPVASSTTPAMDGTATIGAGTTWARADHIHPTDTTRYAASNPAGYQTAANVTTTLAPYATTAAVAAGYLPLTGGTINGSLTMSGGYSFTSGGSVTLGGNLYANTGNLQGKGLIWLDTNTAGHSWQSYAAFDYWKLVTHLTVTAIQVNPDASCWNQSGTWTAISDPRVKTAITFYPHGLDAVLALEPITYRYNGEGDTPLDADDVVRIGLDAAATQAVIPEAVNRRPGTIGGVKTDLLGVDNGPVIWALVNAVKELEARLRTLEGP